MCCNTKERIARALHGLLQDRPLNRITVQDIMDRAGMNRQSFYYHFKDVRDVLEWYCSGVFSAALSFDPAQSNEAWVWSAMQMLDSDRVFFRRVVAAADRSQVAAWLTPLVRPRMAWLLYGSAADRALSDEQQYAIDFLTGAQVNGLIDFVSGHEPLPSQERICRRIRYLEQLLSAGGGPVPAEPPAPQVFSWVV